MNGFDLFCGIFVFLIIGFGIFGNILSFIIWTTGRRCKKLPGGIYLRVLAVSDTIALLIPGLNEAVTLVTTLNTRTENDFCCKLELAGRHFGLMVSSWIIVSFTLERTLAIFRPMATTNLISKKGTITLMTCIFVVIFFMNLPYGIVYGIKEDVVVKPSVSDSSYTLNSNHSEWTGSNATTLFENVTIVYSRQCYADKASLFHLANWYHIWLMDIILIFALPFAIITGSNIIVIYILCSRKNAMISKLDSKVKAVTMRAVAISVMHCVTSGPFTISTVFPGFLYKAMTMKYSNEYYVMQITLILAYSNHAVNFLLYSFFGTDFRRDCVDLFLKKKSTVHPISSTIYPVNSTHQQKKTSGTEKTSERTQSVSNSRMVMKTGKTTVSIISSL